MRGEWPESFWTGCENARARCGLTRSRKAACPRGFAEEGSIGWETGLKKRRRRGYPKRSGTQERWIRGPCAGSFSGNCGRTASNPMTTPSRRSRIPWSRASEGRRRIRSRPGCSTHASWRSGSVPGRDVVIDGTGRASPLEPPPSWRDLILHLPRNSRSPCLVVGRPPELTRAQRATVAVLVTRKTSRPGT